MNYKISSIKIYFNPTIENEPGNNEETEPIANKDQEEDKEFLNEKYIIGLTITYKNI